MTAYQIRTKVWPPGVVECEYGTSAGVSGESTYVPWLEWASVALFATGGGLALSAFLPERRRRIARLLGAVGLVLAGVVVWFAPDLIVVVLIAWVAGAALVLWNGRAPRPGARLTARE